MYLNTAQYLTSIQSVKHLRLVLDVDAKQAANKFSCLS